MTDTRKTGDKAPVEITEDDLNNVAGGAIRGQVTPVRQFQVEPVENFQVEPVENFQVEPVENFQVTPVRPVRRG